MCFWLNFKGVDAWTPTEHSN